MRRTFGALVAAGLLVTVLAGTASAAPSKAAPPKHVGGTSFVTTACVDAQNEMVFHVDWANVTIDQTKDLTVTWTLNGRNLTATPVGTIYSPTYDDPSFADFSSPVLVGPTGPIDWDAWRTIGTTAAGAFDATAKTVRRPGHGWSAC
jgi:hypothetical protein